jgi:hypothetical protein
MKIFISHATADHELVEALIELLQMGAGVQHTDIFYSKNSIPNGSFFVQSILGELADAGLILSVLSHAYFDSDFCLAEAGAGLMRRVAANAAFYSLIVPPATFGELGGALSGVQSGKILTSQALSELRDVVTRGIANPPGTAAWNDRQSQFLKTAAQIVSRYEDAGLAKKIVVEDLSLIQHDNNVTTIFKSKVRIVLKNGTGKVVEVGPMEWDPSGDTVPLQAVVSPMKLQVRGSKDPEKPIVQVPAGGSLSTWIGVAKTVTDEEVLRRCATRRVGGLKYTVTIAGQNISQETRL